MSESNSSGGIGLLGLCCAQGCTQGDTVMSLDYPDRKVWLAKRYTSRNKHKHERLVVAEGTFTRGRGQHGLGKSAKRRARAARIAKIYREFFSDPTNQAQIAAHKLTWCIPLHPRLVRDVVLGSMAGG